MTATITLVRRARRHVRSIGDAMLLARVVGVLLFLPLAARWAWPRLVAGLDRLSTLIAVGPGERAARIQFYARACGTFRWGPFQDNCVTQSLARFALLNHRDRPLDVLIGVRVDGRGEGGPRLGRRHVWLTTAEGHPFLESEPVDDYVVQFRYREHAVARTPRPGLARFVLQLGTSAAASAAAAAASVVRTKIVAVSLGPPGLALVGQMSSAVSALAWVSTFGTAGAARFLAEALGRGDLAGAATIVRTSAMLLFGAAAVTVAGGTFAAAPLADLLFGHAATWPVYWLLAAVPAAAVASAGGAVLRGTQCVGQLAAVRASAAAVSVAACALLVGPGNLERALFVPLAFVAATAVTTLVAAWPVSRRWLAAGGAWFSWSLARSASAYGAANLIMGFATAAAMLVVGRHYLAAGDLEAAGRIAALAWLGEPLVSAFASGHDASTFPAYAAARGPIAAAVLSRGVRGLVVLAAPLLCLIAVTAEPLVALLFSPAFNDIAGLIGLQALAVYIRSANVVFGMPLLARGHLVTVTVLHVAWAVSWATGTIVWTGPGVAAASAFAAACALSAAGHFFAQLVALRRYGLTPAGSDLLWLVAGAAPLAWVALS